MPCPACDDCRWVCENHPDRPLKGFGSNRADACECGAGMPCPICNHPEEGDPPAMPPGFIVTIDDKGPRH
jgi:hypothetical protein